MRKENKNLKSTMEEIPSISSDAGIATENQEKMKLADIDLEEFIPKPSDIEIKIKRKPTKIPVGKPNNQQWYQIHQEWEFTLNTIKWKEDNKFFPVMRNVLPFCKDFVKSMKFFVGILTSGSVFLFPVEQPNEEGERNSWHESAERAVIEGRKGWRRLEPDRSINGYQVLEPEGDLGKPIWPEITKQEILELAFKDNIIKDENHPVVKALLGRQLL